MKMRQSMIILNDKNFLPKFKYNLNKLKIQRQEREKAIEAVLCLKL